MEGKQCKKCRAIKPLAEFKRKLSRAQSIAKGYSGNYQLEVESAMCKACRPKTKPASVLTKKELHNKIMSGDLREHQAEEILERRAQLKPLKQGMASRKQWEKKWAGDLRALLKPMQEEIRSVERQIRYSCTDQPERLKFFEWYVATLRSEKAKIEFDYAKKPRRVPECIWQDLMSGTVIVQARETWGEIPIEKRFRMKQPALVVYRPKI
jgi:hypothetical protein